MVDSSSNPAEEGDVLASDLTPSRSSHFPVGIKKLNEQQL
jgi:hypothetical protein